MSQEEQLTVAEILARAQAENPDVGRRRRRRRSLDEGGVTVAEITGSFGKVDARPVEPRHSSVPIDTPGGPASRPLPPTASSPVAPPFSSAPTTQHPAVQYTPKVGRRAESMPPQRPAGPAQPPTRTSPTPPSADRPRTGAPGSRFDAGPTLRHHGAEQPLRDGRPVEPQLREPYLRNADPFPDRGLDLDRPLSAGAGPVPGSAPSTPFEHEGAGRYGVTTQSAPRASEEQTRSFEKVGGSTATKLEPQPRPARTGERQDPNSVERRLDNVSKPASADHIASQEETVNPIALVLLVFAGIVLGILVFLLFQWVWAHVGTGIAIGLSIAAIAAVVTGVGALRSGRDGLTMSLAGLATAVATFGPALL